NKFVLQFKEFCQRGVSSYTELGSPIPAAFYLEITDKFERFLSFFSEKYPHLISYTPPEIRPAEGLRSLIDRNLHSRDEAVFLYLDLLLMQTPETLNEK